MTFRELAFQEDLKLAAPLRKAESEQGFFQQLLENQSPVMKVWFVIMALNLVMFLFVIH